MAFQKVATIKDLWSGEIMGRRSMANTFCWSTLIAAFMHMLMLSSPEESSK